MKKILILIIALILSGCSNSTKQEKSTDVLYKEYQTYIDRLEKQETFETKCDFFDVKVIVNTTNKGNYRYDIIVDNSKIEMHTIKILASVNDGDKIVYSTIGILEAETFSLVPGVVDKEKNMYKGINLSSIGTNKEVKVKLYLTYTNQDSDELQERFIQV